jgi:hypothetical protein
LPEAYKLSASLILFSEGQLEGKLAVVSWTMDHPSVSTPASISMQQQEELWHLPPVCGPALALAPLLRGLMHRTTDS